MLLILYTRRVRTWGRCTSSGKRSRRQHQTVQDRPTWWLERSPVVQYTAVISRSAHLFRGLSQTLRPQWLLLVSAANTKHKQQESWAIVKMTARCALYYTWVPWKFSRVPEYAQGYLAFISIDTKNVRTNFELRSFIRSWDNREYSKNGKSLYAPCLLFSKIFDGLLLRWTLWIYRPNLKSVALPVPEIIAIAVLGWGCEPPILGKRRPQGVGNGTVRKSVGEFL